jgi:dihydroxy-acid dehydratase
MKPKSGKIRNEWLQLDTLCCGMDWDEADLKKPQILVEDAGGDSHPGSVHLDSLAREASIGIFQEGGKPARFHGTDICDWWAMLHSGMNFILPSREVLCDLV